MGNLGNFSPEFVEEIRSLRSKRRLHGSVSMALKEAFQGLFPDWVLIPEIQQTSGGRNDAVLFELWRGACRGGLPQAGSMERMIRLMLQAFPGNAQVDVVQRYVFCKLRDVLRREPEQIRRVGSILLTLAMEDFAPSEDVRNEMYLLEDYLECARGGIFGDVDEIRREVQRFLEPHLRIDRAVIEAAGHHPTLICMPEALLESRHEL